MIEPFSLFLLLGVLADAADPPRGIVQIPASSTPSGVVPVYARVGRRYLKLVELVKRLGPEVDRAYESGDLDRAELLDTWLTGATEILESMYHEIVEEGETPRPEWGWYVDAEDDFLETLASWWQRHLEQEQGLYGGYQSDEHREEMKGYLASALKSTFAIELSPEEAFRLAEETYEKRRALIDRYRQKRPGRAMVEVDRFLERVRK